MNTLIEIATNLPKISQQTAKDLSMKSRIEWKTLGFLHQNIFPIKMTLWRGRMQFLQPRRENFNIRSKKIAQCKKKIKKYIFFRKKYLKCFYGHIESSFHNFVEKFPTKGQKLSPTVPKRKIKQYFFWKYLFEKMFVWARRKQF